MTHARYTIHFKVFDPSVPVLKHQRELLIGKYDCALRSLVEQAFAQDAFWKYEERCEVGVFVRSDASLSIRACTDDDSEEGPANIREVQFNPYMTNVEFEENYDEIVRACGLISDTIFTFTRGHLDYRTRPSWCIVRTVSYE